MYSRYGWIRNGGDVPRRRLRTVQATRLLGRLTPARIKLLD
jgi:hypothetical protein